MTDVTPNRLGHDVIVVTPNHVGHDVTVVIPNRLGHDVTVVTFNHLGHDVTVVTPNQLDPESATSITHCPVTLTFDHYDDYQIYVALHNETQLSPYYIGCKYCETCCNVPLRWVNGAINNLIPPLVSLCLWLETAGGLADRVCAHTLHAAALCCPVVLCADLWRSVVRPCATVQH
ncbi:hypothetical protein RRG08_064237 [Elysia crispata]|uniref:Uncharacterized protein n=1 Tax=Elysia crispata TaxID=231223 RepID=A0AAE1CXY9_9GAST|nr:hypothetical protein RRG08_064237 [Elysia crispata]